MKLDFQKIFESNNKLCLILSPKFQIIGGSNEYLKANFTKRQDVIGRDMLDIFANNKDISLKEVNNLKSSLQKVVKNKIPDLLSVQKNNIVKSSSNNDDSEVQYWHLLNTPILNDFNEVTYIIHELINSNEYNIENTKQKKYKIIIDEQTKQLENINKELESFSYSISHDLRGPLRSINGYASVLEEEYSTKIDEEGKRLLSIIKYNAEKMGQLIDVLVSFSRLTRKEIQKRTIDMNELVEGALFEINKTTKHHAKIKTNKLHQLQSDYGLINQVMVNLISNAIKYSAKKETPIIEINSKLSEGDLVFSVKDNGVGFDTRYSNKLFGIFQRFHSQDEFEGNGVGLAIVQRIVLKHGGKVWADAKINQGAQFYFSIPQ